MGPLVMRSTASKVRIPNDSFLKGRYGGCQRLPGVKSGMMFLLCNLFLIQPFIYN
jgi:hypothetical protein